MANKITVPVLFGEKEELYTMSAVYSVSYRIWTNNE